MQNLKNKIKAVLLIHLFSLLAACQSTKSFEIKSNPKDELNEIRVSSDRVVQECYFLNAAEENNWRHQYLIHILNDKNEVITAMHPVSLDDDQCNDQKKKVEKILKKGSILRLCLRDLLEKETETDKSGTPERYYDFGPLGKYTSASSPYYYLTFDTICNSEQCFSISDTWTYTCPGFK